MALPSYPAARSVAVTVQQHFSRHLASARTRGREDLAPEPDESVIEAMIDAGFWASLRREEGLTPKISLAYMPPETAEQPLLFTHPLSLAPAVLAKVAPAVERPGIHLGVWTGPDGLQVWGTTRRLPPYCFVLEGDQVKVIDERNAFLPECPGLVQSLLGFDLMATDGASPNVLVQLAASMRAHGRGGALLVVPSGSESWRDSIVSPITYAVGPPFSGLADLLRQDAVETTSHEWQEELRRAVDALAGLTAVDGATVIDNRYSLLAFGAKITRKRGSVTVERVVVTEPIVDSPRTTAMPTQFGGTRHLSAAQFVHDQRDAFALVASQDGRFTIFKWSPNEDMVHAHRVEALLL